MEEAKQQKASKIQLALRAAKGIRLGLEDPKRIEADFLSATSRSATASRLKTMRVIMGELAPTQPWASLKVSTQNLKAVGSVLKVAGYRAAPTYLHDLKVRHVENGHAWTDHLDLTFKRVKRALERDSGPRCKAPEVPEADLRRKPWPRVRTTGVKLAHELFLFAMVWMLRAFELTYIQAQHLEVDSANKTVSLKWTKSKGDQKASGLRRTLGCRCASVDCDALCPFKICVNLRDKLIALHPSATHLAWSGVRVVKDKSVIVKAWNAIFRIKVGGHSARRTGALRYIRSGWAIPQVAYLGRWKSDVIYQYAEEALAAMPVNPLAQESAPTFASIVSPEEAEVLGLQDPVEGPTVRDWLDVEVQRFRLDSKTATKELRAEIKQLKKQQAQATEAPHKVRNMKSGTVHANASSTVTTPSYAWRTLCGWRYHAADYVFAPSSCTVTCSKCTVWLSASQEGSFGGAQPQRGLSSIGL